MLLYRRYHSLNGDRDCLHGHSIRSGGGDMKGVVERPPFFFIMVTNPVLSRLTDAVRRVY